MKLPISFVDFLTVCEELDFGFALCFTGGLERDGALIAFETGFGCGFGVEDGFAGLPTGFAGFCGAAFLTEFPLTEGGLMGLDACCLRVGDLSLHLQ